MSTQLTRLIAEQNRLFARMQDIQRAAEDESRDWTAEERVNWDTANARLDEVCADIERLEQMARRDEVDYSGVINATGATGATGVNTFEDTPETRAARRAEAYAVAFDHYARRRHLTAEQQQLLINNSVPEERGATAQMTTPGAAGGYLIPPGFLHQLVQALKAYGGLYDLANVIITDTGNPLAWPTNDDTGNTGYILSPENTPVSVNNVTFGTATLGAHTYCSGLVLVSWQLLQDSVFELEPFLAEAFATRIGRASAAHFIAGTGAGQPLGIVSGVRVTTVGPAGGGITYDNLIDLEHSLDPAYRRLGNARWVMSDQMLALIRKLKDSQGHPLYNPVPVSGEPATINGRPYSIDLGIAAPGPNAVSLLFGDVKRGYTIRQVHHVQMVALHERYADQLASGFFAYSRLDAAPNDAKAKAVTISSLSAYTCREVVRPMKMSRRRRSAGHSTTARACKPTATRNDQ